MFTIKLYQDSGRLVIRSAESFSILRDAASGEAEITLHQKNPAEDCRFDILDADTPRGEGWPAIFQRAIIESPTGKTTEILALGPHKSSARPSQIAAA